MSNTGNYQIELDKPNWFQRLFKRKRRRKEYTLGAFIWSLYWHQKHIQAMYNYESRLAYDRGCDFMVKVASRKFRSVNGLHDDSSPHTVWWILEQYELGNLIEKQKEDVQPE